MLERTRQLRFLLQITIVIGLACSAVLANGSIGAVIMVPPKLCYCGCAHETGFHHCTKMCQLPQYKDRWWATSCKKKPSASLKSEPQTPHTDTRKTNYLENARRHKSRTEAPNG